MAQLIHNIGHSIELRTNSSKELPLWRYVYGDGKPKPYFHPLCAPKTGIPLTNFEPFDHTWHRGLWFTIKYVNGVNFWEEAEPYGFQVSERVPQVFLSNNHPNRISLSHALEWKYPDGRSALREVLNVFYEPLGDNAYSLEFWIRLKPYQDTVFDRTPFTAWGGYSGLCLRGARHWRDTRFILPDGETDQLRRGQSTPWCELYGQLDGGGDLSAGIAFFDYPSNPRYPTPFYGHAGDDQKGGPMLNAAFLFHEPMAISANADDYFLLRYCILVHDRLWTTEQIQNAYQDYTQETSSL